MLVFFCFVQYLSTQSSQKDVVIDVDASFGALPPPLIPTLLVMEIVQDPVEEVTEPTVAPTTTTVSIIEEALEERCEVGTSSARVSLEHSDAAPTKLD